MSGLDDAAGVNATRFSVLNIDITFSSSMSANNAFTELMMSLEKIAKFNPKYGLALRVLYKDGVAF